MVGSGSTSENTCALMPASSNATSTGSTTLSSRSTASVTTKAERAPRSAIIRTSWVDDPGPVNMNGVGAGTSLVAIPKARTRRRATRWFTFESFFGGHVDRVSVVHAHKRRIALTAATAVSTPGPALDGVGRSWSEGPPPWPCRPRAPRLLRECPLPAPASAVPFASVTLSDRRCCAPPPEFA